MSIKTAGYSNKFPQRERRRVEAEQRKEQRNKRNAREQLVLIRQRPGKSTKEFERLMKEVVV